jgi:hypothetical protein
VSVECVERNDEKMRRHAHETQSNKTYVPYCVMIENKKFKIKSYARAKKGFD